MSKLELIKDFYAENCNWKLEDLDGDSVDIIYELILKDRVDTKVLTKECAFLIGLYYDSVNQSHMGNYYMKVRPGVIQPLAVKYYLKALHFDPKDTFIIRQIATYYWRVEDDRANTVKYFLMAINLGDTQAMIDLALYYQDILNYKRTIKYFLMAVKQGNTEAMLQLGNYYHYSGDYDNAVVYYEMAMRNGNQQAIIVLASHYEEQKTYYKMIKYLLITYHHNPHAKIIRKLSEYICDKQIIQFVLRIYGQIKDKKLQIQMLDDRIANIH